jgi:cold shock CspA family protein
MSPLLHQIVLNGASRHRLDKGFFLVGSTDQAISAPLREHIMQRTRSRMALQPGLEGFRVAPRPAHTSLVSIITPFLPVYSVQQRTIFIEKLATAVRCLLESADESGYSVLAAGVNPCVPDDNSPLPAALCADIHQVEVFDEDEVERIYNMYRQFMPELLALSAHSLVYGNVLQKEYSYRMSCTPDNYLPRYLSQFSIQQLDRLKNMMRKDYRLFNLHLMDINPLGGNGSLLEQENPPLLESSASAVELRFMDAQYSFPFMRAQIILIQALAIHARALTREGRRLSLLIRDKALDQNKALAIQNGATAMFKPDTHRHNDKHKDSFSYHDRGVPERAMNALLAIIDELLLPALQDLDCQVWELLPIVLGAELRQRYKPCLTNYAEYQQYLWYAFPEQFVAVFQHQTLRHFLDVRYDDITNYNQEFYSDLAAEISEEWRKKLRPQDRCKGVVQYYNVESGQGMILYHQERILVLQRDIEGTEQLRSKQEVFFEIAAGKGGRKHAARVRAARRQRHNGRVADFDAAKGYGFIQDETGRRFFVHASDVIGARKVLQANEAVTFEKARREKGVRAVRVRIVE